MYRSLGADIVEGEAEVVLVDYICFDFLRYYFVKDRRPWRRDALSLCAANLITIRTSDSDGRPTVKVIDIGRISLFQTEFQSPLEYFIEHFTEIHFRPNRCTSYSFEGMLILTLDIKLVECISDIDTFSTVIFLIFNKVILAFCMVYGPYDLYTRSNIKICMINLTNVKENWIYKVNLIITC